MLRAVGLERGRSASATQLNATGFSRGAGPPTARARRKELGESARGRTGARRRRSRRSSTRGDCWTAQVASSRSKGCAIPYVAVADRDVRDRSRSRRTRGSRLSRRPQLRARVRESSSSGDVRHRRRASPAGRVLSRDGERGDDPRAAGKTVVQVSRRAGEERDGDRCRGTITSCHDELRRRSEHSTRRRSNPSCPERTLHCSHNATARVRAYAARRVSRRPAWVICVAYFVARLRSCDDQRVRRRPARRRSRARTICWTRTRICSAIARTATCRGCGAAERRGRSACPNRSSTSSAAESCRADRAAERRASPADRDADELADRAHAADERVDLLRADHGDGHDRRPMAERQPDESRC